MYRVLIRTGHAQGWSYETSIVPDEMIHVAPCIGEAHGPWMRVPDDADPPWPGQKRYRRATPEAMDDDVVVVPYDMEPDQRIVPMGPRPGVN